MIRLDLAAVAATVLVLGGIGVSGATAAAPGTQEEPQREKKICRTEKATGSLTRRTRICMTEAQWRELNARTRRGVDEMNSAASGGKACVPDPADPFQGCS
jgi:hypothetical protein